LPQQSISRRSLLAASGLTAAGAMGAVGLAAPASAQAAEPPAPTPATALNRLLAGNKRFYKGEARHPRQSPRDLRELANTQDPFAITLGCADSRVAPELLFDQGLGDLFDNRVAGNIVDDLLLGSIEFAIEEFGAPLIMVLGHERCGAIVATMDAIEHGESAPGHIGTIVDALRPVVEPLLGGPGDVVEAAVRANVLAQAQYLLDASDIIQEKVHEGALGIVGARYDLDNGKVALLN
jgi:carbonic anhydrase